MWKDFFSSSVMITVGEGMSVCIARSREAAECRLDFERHSDD